ncbi:MAG TPA: luciferase [Bdellovibrionales bacterium]|nr:luciferase [Pseudobdellovibrionaceae bacterium]HAG91700.1 luciferase [Bdellovibrionales bacterium]|tara:strand:+ start:783 stop:1988 length:1206 start_codon:yes stop_codon:yes gene_type:complete
MMFDVFFSICQTEVDGYMPSEKVMFENFFDQVKLADELNYGVAWIAETHLSCEIQKTGSQPVIPHFKGEIGLNTDVLQMAHKIFSMTKNIEVGSAIRNILCNGGPIAHAEAIRTFLALHGMDPQEKRKLQLGFASGRFEFSNRPYGIVPRNEVEKAAWPVVKGKILKEATQIFLRLLKGEKLSSADLPKQTLTPGDFRSEEDWKKVQKAFGSPVDVIVLEPRYQFEKVGVIPFDVNLDLLKLTIGTHDPNLQIKANQILPVGVFNLSITPPHVIEETHKRMEEHYQGEWKRSDMPRTAMIFMNDDEGLSREEKRAKALEQAQSAWENYWKAMEGTLDSSKVEQAVGNALAGSPEDLVEQIREKYHPEDRLMLWFDFNNHDNEMIQRNMRSFAEKVRPHLEG